MKRVMIHRDYTDFGTSPHARTLALGDAPPPPSAEAMRAAVSASPVSEAGFAVATAALTLPGVESDHAVLCLATALETAADDVTERRSQSVTNTATITTNATLPPIEP